MIDVLQENIINNWKKEYHGKPLLSVLCITYNHEKFIGKAIDSFLMQKTDFPFEIIIHDDCSTDNTASIIRRYVEKYPKIIKPIYQQENKYSKGVPIALTFLFPNAKGKYFSMCEGDDYWTDEYKLQKQVDFLQDHPEYSMCIHNNIVVTENGSFVKNWMVTKDISRDCTTWEVIVGDGGFCPTNSIVAYTKFISRVPYYFHYLALDYTLQVHLAVNGKVYCFADKMGAYRSNVKGSWTERLKKSGNDGQVIIREKLINVRNLIDKETYYKYHEAFEFANINDEYRIIRMRREYGKLRDERYKKLICTFSFWRKIRTYLRMYLWG